MSTNAAAMEGTFKNSRVLAIRYILFGLNITVIVFISFVIYDSINQLSSSFSARAFLDTVAAIPWHPVANMFLSILLLCVISLSYILREYMYPNWSAMEYGTLIVDFAASIALVLVLGFNYNGILLWVFANLVARAKHTKGRFMLMFFAVICFLMTDYNILSLNFRLYSVLDYINTYSANVQIYLLTGYRVMNAVNIILFIMYCVFMIQLQRGTIEEVNQLYQKLEQANQNLQDANLQLQDFAIMQEKMGETRERNRLAREIHDTIGHTLTGISAGLDACLTIVDSAPEQAKEQLARVSEVTRQGINDVRRSVHELRPDALQRFGLEHALQKMIADTTRMTDTKVYLNAGLAAQPMGEDEENAAYRIVQEAITNAIRHGKAQHVWVTLATDDENTLQLTVQDDGIGCEAIHKGFGTRHMTERARMLNGTVEFNGSHGFLVHAEIPIRKGQAI